MISIAASMPFCPPAITMSYQRRPVGSASMAGSPPWSFGKKPMLSEWSATTRKSRGRESFTGSPVEEVSSSPFAKR